MKKLLVLLLSGILTLSCLITSASAAGVNSDLNGAAKHLKSKFGLEDPLKEFKVLRVTGDELGYKHVKLQQIVEGIPVYGGEYIVHFNNKGDVYSDTGKFFEKARGFKSKGEYINKKQAIGIAEEAVGYSEEDSKKAINQADSVSADLYLYNFNGEFIPVYIVRINWLHEDSFGDWRVFVNAYTGEVVRKYDSIEYPKPSGGTVSGTAVTGTGTGVLGDSKAINLTLSSTTYYLQDISKPMSGYILTYNANNKTRLPGTLMSDSDTLWNSTVQYAGVDANYYAGAVYDYYYSKFQRNSINNSGMSIKSTVHYGVDYVNAFWNGSQMVYGDGDGVEAIALSGALDVVAHELTHGVNSYEANLEYQDQSGALSESFSDVFGTAVEFSVQPEKADWLIGEDIWTPAIEGDALRSMEDPTLYGDPDNMDDYVVTTSDNGGVHTNCGIPNKAAYLVGSTIGVDKMEKIYYRALTAYLTTTSDFSDCRAALLQSAADFYGAGSGEYIAVSNAFDAVGIY